MRCCRGQKNALEELVRSWELPLFYYVRRLIENEQEAWAVLQETWVGYLVISGKYGLRINLSHITGIGLAISFILTIVFTLVQEYALVRANPQDWRVKLDEQFAVTIFFMLIFVGLFLILRVLYRLEFKIREKLLEIEYRILDLAEKMENQQSQQNIRNQ